MVRNGACVIVGSPRSWGRTAGRQHSSTHRDRMYSRGSPSPVWRTPSTRRQHDTFVPPFAEGSLADSHQPPWAPWRHWMSRARSLACRAGPRAWSGRPTRPHAEPGPGAPRILNRVLPSVDIAGEALSRHAPASRPGPAPTGAATARRPPHSPSAPRRASSPYAGFPWSSRTGHPRLLVRTHHVRGPGQSVAVLAVVIAVALPGRGRCAAVPPRRGPGSRPARGPTPVPRRAGGAP